MSRREEGSIKKKHPLSSLLDSIQFISFVTEFIWGRLKKPVRNCLFSTNSIQFRDINPLEFINLKKGKKLVANIFSTRFTRTTCHKTHQIYISCNNNNNNNKHMIIKSKMFTKRKEKRSILRAWKTKKKERKEKVLGLEMNAQRNNGAHPRVITGSSPPSSSMLETMARISSVASGQHGPFSIFIEIRFSASTGLPP